MYESELLDETIRTILTFYSSVQFVILFGSLATNRAKFTSDMDMTIQNKKVFNACGQMRLINDE